MLSLRAVSGGIVVVLGLVAAACDRAASPAPDRAAEAATAASAASAPPPMAGITPHVEEVPAYAKGTGPAEGSTAVGGVVGNQDSGGAKKGGTPAPTGGDAAASSPP